MSVSQQVIKDKVNGTPTSDITRANGNKGLLVKLSGTQTELNENAYASPKYELTDAAADTIRGVLGDYHHKNLISICRKGRIVVAAASEFVSADIGLGIITVAAGTDNEGKAEASSSGIGEILDGGVHGDDDIGDYYLVDLNLP